MSVHDVTLSLVVPVRNDAASLLMLVPSVLDVLSAVVRDFEVIIVDDGSDDSTPEQASQLAATHAPVLVIHHAFPQGYGGAATSGLCAARGDYVLCTDVPGAVCVDTVRRLLTFLDHYDVIVGCFPQERKRYTERVRQWLHRRLAPDPRVIDCRLLIGRSDLLQSMTPVLRSRLIFAELYTLALQSDIRCALVDVSYHVRQDQLARLGQVPWWDLLRLRGMRTAKAGRLAQQRPVWQHKTTFGAGLALVVGGIWLLRRRLGS